MQRPSYEGDGIVNLMASIGATFGAPLPHHGAVTLEPGLDAAQNVVLWVIDGLGDDYLGAHPNSFLALHRRRALSSVFPATTAAAVTTFLTGLSPAAHGVTGWFIYTRELGAVTAWLPFAPRCGRASWAQLVPESQALLAQPAFGDRPAAETHLVQPEALVDTPYSRAVAGAAQRHGFKGLGGLVEEVGRIAARQGRRRRYIYVYWPDFDALCHLHGVGSRQAAEHFQEIDRAFGRLLDALSQTNTRVLATADHGFVDTDSQHVIHLEDHPELAATLALPLCGEPRAAYCYLRAGAEADFDGYVRERLSGRCSAAVSAELVSEGWFGPEPEHPELRRRIGDRVLLPAGNAVVKDRLIGEGPFELVGVHGGASLAEQRVPLIVA